MRQIKGIKLIAFEDAIFCEETCPNLDNNQCRVTGEFLKQAKNKDFDLYFKHTFCKMYAGGTKLADTKESSVIDEDNKIFLNKIESILI